RESAGSGEPEEFVPRSTGIFGTNGRKPAGSAETRNVSTRKSGTSGTKRRGGRERAGRPADQPGDDTCHKGKVQKSK
ncbi:hypothetical protein KI387_009755, partial [Taxus chinensis]